MLGSNTQISAAAPVQRRRKAHGGLELLLNSACPEEISQLHTEGKNEK